MSPTCLPFHFSFLISVFPVHLPCYCALTNRQTRYVKEHTDHRFYHNECLYCSRHCYHTGIQERSRDNKINQSLYQEDRIFRVVTWNVLVSIFFKQSFQINSLYIVFVASVFINIFSLLSQNCRNEEEKKTKTVTKKKKKYYPLCSLLLRGKKYRREQPLEKRQIPFSRPK